MKEVVRKIKNLFNKNHQKIQVTLMIQNKDEIIQNFNEFISKLKEAKALADELASVEIAYEILTTNQSEEHNYTGCE